jgi:hypothetical protein
MGRVKIGPFFLGPIVLISMISQLQSCKNKPESIANLPTVCFDTQIQPILSVCTQCHSGNSKQGGGGFNPTNYNSIMKSVKPGNPWGSKLYTIVSSPNNPNMMPPKGHEPLSIGQRTLIEVWILQGAKEIKCDTTAATVN